MTLTPPLIGGASAATASALPPDVLFVDQFDDTFMDDEHGAFVASQCNVAELTAEVHHRGRDVSVGRPVVGMPATRLDP